MPDTVRPSPTSSDTDQQLYKLTLSQVADLFAAADLPRSYRTIQRYCERGRLDCLKTETTTGEQYFVTEASVTRAIAELKQLYALKDMSSHAQPNLDTPSHVQPEKPAPETVDKPGQSHDRAGRVQA